MGTIDRSMNGKPKQTVIANFIFTFGEDVQAPVSYKTFQLLDENTPLTQQSLDIFVAEQERGWVG